MKPQELLKNWLRRNKMTAKDLADRAGTNHSGVYRYLNGDTDSMRTSTAFILAKATGFELDVCDLLGIQPRIVFRCPKGCEMDLHESKNESAPYNMDVSAHSVNTPSSSVGRVSTSSELLTQVTQPENAAALLQHWASAFRKTLSRVKLTPKRKTAVRAALKAKWTIDDLKRSIDGWASVPWRHDDPIRNELVTLLRPENIEGGLVVYQKSGLAPPPPVDDSWVARQQEQEALRETQDGN